MKEDFFPYLDSCINENKLAHAFLVETNDCEKITLEITKFLFEKKLIQTEDLLNNLNLIVIEPEGKEIKSGNIALLHTRFATLPVNNKFNIYIIKEAGQMNSSAANKLLKFLEEPTDFILGFLVSNINSTVMETIRSRCQSFKILTSESEVNNNQYVEALLGLSPETGYETVLNFKKMFLELERGELFIVIKQAIKCLESKLLLEKTNIESVTSNIFLLTQALHLLESNVNIELVLDKLWIEVRK